MLANTVIRAVIRARGAAAVIARNSRVTLANGMAKLVMHADTSIGAVMFAWFKTTVRAGPTIATFALAINARAMGSIALQIRNRRKRATIFHWLVTSTARPAILANTVTDSAATMNTGYGARCNRAVSSTPAKFAGANTIYTRTMLTTFFIGRATFGRCYVFTLFQKVQFKNTDLWNVDSTFELRLS